MLEWIVMRCLAKNPDDRWQTVRDLRAALERVLQEPAAPASQKARASAVPWIVAALAVLVAIGVAAWSAATIRRAPAGDTRMFMSEFVAPTTPTGPPALRLSISPDGRRLAYTAPDSSGRIVLWIHSLDTLSTQPLPGTTNATAPFWAPDSRRLAFIADGKLKKIDISSGTITTICDATTGPPGTWNKDDVILFTGGPGHHARRRGRRDSEAGTGDRRKAWSASPNCPVISSRWPSLCLCVRCAGHWTPRCISGIARFSRQHTAAARHGGEHQVCRRSPPVRSRDDVVRPTVRCRFVEGIR